MVMDINEIMSIIPHRQPFLLIDRIESMEEGKSITALKNVSYNEPFFAGHFPDQPVMPGVLIIEAMAQVGAVSLLSDDKYKGKTPLFGGIKNAKFRRKVVPGDVLRMEVEMTRVRGPLGIGEGKAYVDGELCAQAELVFAIQ